MAMLEVNNLRISFGTQSVVNDVSFHIDRGERVCIIGESGSGKSLTARALIGLLPPDAAVSGQLMFSDRSVLTLSESQLCALRGNDIGFVFQEPQTALNPVIRIKNQLVAARLAHGRIHKSQALANAIELAASVGLPNPPEIVNRFPHELSGGQRQRVVIAMAMSCEPLLLIADEPTTALDATVQGRILDLMIESTAKKQTALLMITHDMGVAARSADRLIVMKSGQVVETGPVRQVLQHPEQAYTRNLVAAARKSSLRRTA